MAQNKTSKNSNLIDYLVVTFVLITSMLVLVEIGGNVTEEVKNRSSNQSQIVETTQSTPTPPPTLTPKELEEWSQQHSGN